MAKTFKAATSILQTLRTKGRPPKGRSAVELSPYWNGLGGMRENLELLGLTEDIRRLHVIHVAGTKGKGATCAFVDSFLKAHRQQTGLPRKVGLYTSPHIFCVRDRIRINFQPISEQLFTDNFFYVWQKISNHVLQNSYRPPGFLQLLTVLSIYTFIKEGVDVAIYETHSGGEYDATNVLQPVVTGISTLGIDHVETLGPTIERIAWHKGGIFKPGVPAYSSTQTQPARQALELRAQEKDADLKFVEVDPHLRDAALFPDVQKLNASLGLELCRAYLEHSFNGCQSLTPDVISRGVDQFCWPGRFQHIAQGRLNWFLDVAHNEISLRAAASWFAKITATSDSALKVLVFSHASDRDGTALLTCLWESLKQHNVCIQHVIFCTLESDSSTDDCSSERPVTKQMQGTYAQTWRLLDTKSQVSLQPSILHALEYVRGIDGSADMQTLITGTTRLVRSSLRLIRRM